MCIILILNSCFLFNLRRQQLNTILSDAATAQALFKVNKVQIRATIDH
jgi:hypothetical protein